MFFKLLNKPGINFFFPYYLCPEILVQSAFILRNEPKGLQRSYKSGAHGADLKPLPTHIAAQPTCSYGVREPSWTEVKGSRAGGWNRQKTISLPADGSTLPIDIRSLLDLPKCLSLYTKPLCQFQVSNWIHNFLQHHNCFSYMVHSFSATFGSFLRWMGFNDSSRIRPCKNSSSYIW